MNFKLAEIQLKVHTGEQLSPIEAKMWENSLRALFDTWAQGYGAYRTGVMSEESWQDWDTAIFTLWERERMGVFWEDMGYHWEATEFGEHINQEISLRSSSGTSQ